MGERREREKRERERERRESERREMGERCDLSFIGQGVALVQICFLQLAAG